MRIVEKLLLVLTFVATLSIPAMAGVTIHSPANEAEVDSPFSLSATAITCSSEHVAVMGYSFDNSADSIFVEGTLIDTSIAAASGAHTLHVKAWGAGGAMCVTDVAIVVKAGPVGESDGPAIPPDAKAVSNLQTFGGWKEAKDKATSGRATGSMRLVTSPSIHGASREFSTSYKAGGAERYSLDFGDDTEVKNFFYDAWVYLTSSASSISNLEMDMNQVMANGWTVTFGIQCDGYSGTWDYTFNEGSPARSSDRWAHSHARCDLQSWKKDSWHHVQASYSRDDSGRVTYHSVWLDGVENPINATVPSAFSLRWAPCLITNFQIDGRGPSGSNVVYLDNLTISRW